MTFSPPNPVDHSESYTLEDLAQARAYWDSLPEIGGSSGNNPDVNRSVNERARRQVERIVAFLKANGLLALTPGEELQRVLDTAHPYAKSRTTVSHNGKRYQIRYWPKWKSRSGKTVHEWAHEWAEAES